MSAKRIGKDQIKKNKAVMDLFEKAVVEEMKILNAEEFKDLRIIVQYVEYEVDREKKSFRFTMTVWDNKVIYPSANIWRKLVDYRKRHGSGSPAWFEFVGYQWNEKDVKGLMKPICGEVDITINDQKHVSLNGTVPGFDDCGGLLGMMLRYLFGDDVELFLDNKFSRTMEERRIAGNTLARGNGITGDFYCFRLEERTDRSGGESKYRVGLTDWNQYLWLIISKSADKFSNQVFEKMEVGKWYRCAYQKNWNKKFEGMLDGFLLDVEEIEEPKSGVSEEEDVTSRSICAICVHTKNSVFDGLCTPKEIVAEAQKKGHRAIGIADIGSVQSYSEFQRQCKNRGIKPIYGLEVELVDNRIPIVIGGKDREICEGWDGCSYAILDIETTGLYPLVHDVIQIHVRKCKVLDEDLLKYEEVGVYERYVRIDGKIPESVLELTGITDEHLEEWGVPLVEALEGMMEFVEGCMVVAHNGIDFDIPFLNEHLRRNGLKEIGNTVLDTRNLAHYIFEEQNFKSYRLEALTKKAQVGGYDLEKAHNASYDTQVLRDVFFKYLWVHVKEKKDFEGWKNINEKWWSSRGYSLNGRGSMVLLYAKEQRGIQNIYGLVSKMHVEGYCDGVRLLGDELKNREGLLVVSGIMEGDLMDAVMKGDKELFRKRLERYDYVTVPPMNHFDHEVDRGLVTRDDVQKLVRTMVEWCREHGAKWFFNGLVRYVHEDRDSKGFAVLVHAKGISGKRHRLYSPRKPHGVLPNMSYRLTENLFRDSLGHLVKNEWKEYFGEAIEWNEKLVNEIEDGLEVIKSELSVPKIENCDLMLRELCEGRMKEKYGKNIDGRLWDRYEREIKAITENGFSVIYWVSHLLVKKSMDDGYLVGSRGSVGSSFVAYLSGISEVNPLPPHYYCEHCSVYEQMDDWLESGFDLVDKECSKCGKMMGRDGHNIPFETFLGFDGNKVPDIDLNFSGEYHLKAHEFLMNKFGKDNVFRVGTISTVAERTAMAIVNKYEEEIVALGKPTLSKGEKIWLAELLVDVKRTTGQHPGGILVVPQDMSVHEFSPVNFPANDITSKWKTTHFTFEDLHDALLKFDVLGHDDPTMLKILKDLTGFDPLDVPNRDNRLLEMYSSCEVMGIKPKDLIGKESTGSLGIPEFGTKLTRKITLACKPRYFADLIRISGFSHGTGVWKGNIEKLVKEGGHPLHSVITCRDDITLYLIGQGLDRKDAFGISEMIRKGKGLSESMEKLMVDKGVPQWYIESSRKISYIFPKAHATAYVMMSWRIAFYKLYHPLAFYAAYFTTSLDYFDMDVIADNDKEKIVKQYDYINSLVKQSRSSVNARDKGKMVVYEVAYEFLARGFRFIKPCVNKSESSLFVPVGEENALRLPLRVISGLGASSSDGLVAGRKKEPYTSIGDIQERGGLGKAAIGRLQEVGIIPMAEIHQRIFDDEGNPV